MSDTAHYSRRTHFTAAATTVAPGQKLRPLGRHLAYGADPARQVVISWQELGAVTGPYVRIATEPGKFGPPIAAEPRTLKSELSWQHSEHDFPPHAPPTMSQYYLHVRLGNLSPGTTYHYVVGHQGYDPLASGRIGEIASFRTAPAVGSSAPFNFTAVGDQGIGYNARRANSAIADLAPAFHLALGNLSYAITSGKAGLEGGHTDTDQYDAGRWDAYFAQNDIVAAGIPWMITLGNREMEDWYSGNGYGGSTARFAMPDNAWSGSTGIYSWRYQNVGLLSLDGNDICYRNTANYDHTKGKQLRWFDSQLAKFRADRTIDFIVVYLHHATYATADGGAELVAQQKWAPLFDKHQVDLVLNAHNRLYERTDPIRAGKGTRQVKPRGTVNATTDGTTYLTAGGGGQGLDAIYRNAPESYLDHENTGGTPTMRCFHKNSSKFTETKVSWSRVRYRGYSLVAVDVTPAANGTPAQLKVRALAEDGTLIDEITVRR
ncbi:MULTISPECIES: metallophosphoesterase family protein [unclassified Crossiella]|uniref:purple acid phosphatase family protein n=1 Tax=unclassified Crossiella TaxID=2620835 RepID=UPI0020004D04|nr:MULTISPECIES: metallophosphoesterase family protein [unclassified Crossiella]MCK2244454.1 metallophosphoesterase family protein [Crossiella sp. S99.2]MCK2258085.1 metallophosphoesterase family protein [Crossiella sp. S99.1]